MVGDDANRELGGVHHVDQHTLLRAVSRLRVDRVLGRSSDPPRKVCRCVEQGPLSCVPLNVWRAGAQSGVELLLDLSQAGAAGDPGAPLPAGHCSLANPDLVGEAPLRPAQARGPDG